MVKFKVVMTSNAATKEVALATSSTKLSELKEMLANDKYFGSKAPVRRQRIFYLGRELKSGGRSLCNLGLGKFNNRILHLYIRPAVDASEKSSTTDQVSNSREEVSAVARTRKRNRDTSPSARQFCRHEHANDTVECNDVNEGRVNPGARAYSSTSRPVAFSSNLSGANNLAIDLVDSSDDDVEIIEVL